MIVVVRCPVCDRIKTADNPAHALALLALHTAEESANPMHHWDVEEYTIRMQVRETEKEKRYRE